jgi:hypothetical protein
MSAATNNAFDTKKNKGCNQLVPKQSEREFLQQSKRSEVKGGTQVNNLPLFVVHQPTLESFGFNISNRISGM